MAKIMKSMEGMMGIMALVEDPLVELYVTCRTNKNQLKYGKVKAQFIKC